MGDFHRRRTMTLLLESLRRWVLMKGHLNGKSSLIWQLNVRRLLYQPTLQDTQALLREYLSYSELYRISSYQKVN